MKLTNIKLDELTSKTIKNFIHILYERNLLFMPYLRVHDLLDYLIGE